MSAEATADARDPGAEGGPWSPLRYRAFAVLWLATVLSNIGSRMNDVGAGWLMTELTPSPLMVALVQTATFLPVFLFALPAGALADIVDRRRLLIVAQIGMAAASGVFALLVCYDLVTAPLLLLFTFFLGSGTALVAPAWQAIVPKLVAKADLQPAVALNSVGINISRALGPALAGFIIVGLGLAAPFAVNALSFLAIIVALVWWKPAPLPPGMLPAERFWNAIRTGLRYAGSSRPLKATLLRAVGFFLFASAYWALLPLVAKTEFNGGAKLYGILLGCVGIGAVAGALFLPRLKRGLDADRMVAVGTLGIAAVMTATGLAPYTLAAAIGSLVFGASWVIVLSSLGVSAQVALPDWVRARGLSMFLTVLFGSMSLGSAIWGQAASRIGIAGALMTAAAGATIAVPLTWRAKLQEGAPMDLTPSMHWPEPIVSGIVDNDRGPVVTTVEYFVDAANTADFLTIVREMSHARRRSGAFAWGIVEDVAKPGRFVEYFMESSWIEHLRHHRRVTEADRLIQERLQALHQGPGTPRVSHFLAADTGRPAPSSASVEHVPDHTDETARQRE